MTALNAGRNLSFLSEIGPAEHQKFQRSKQKEEFAKKAQPELHQGATAATNPNTVQCECGTTMSAPSREIALEALAKHKRDEHGEIANQRTEKPPE